MQDTQLLTPDELSGYREKMERERYAPDKPSVRLLATLDVTQAELNRSQAHNALLLDALKKAEPYTYRITDGKPNRTTLICKTAIDITGPAIKAWLDERDEKTRQNHISHMLRQAKVDIEKTRIEKTRDELTLTLKKTREC